MIKIISDDYSVNDYNRQALHPLQAWEWGEARIKTGVEVLRLFAGKNVFQMTFHKIPKTGLKIGYLPRSVFPTKEVLDFLYAYGKKNKILFFKIEPNVKKVSNNETMKQYNNITISPHPLFPSWTQILDLNKSEDELLKSFHSKTR